MKQASHQVIQTWEQARQGRGPLAEIQAMATWRTMVLMWETMDLPARPGASWRPAQPCKSSQKTWNHMLSIWMLVRPSTYWQQLPPQWRQRRLREGGRKGSKFTGYYANYTSFSEKARSFLFDPRHLAEFNITMGVENKLLGDKLAKGRKQANKAGWNCYANPASASTGQSLAGVSGGEW